MTKAKYFEDQTFSILALEIRPNVLPSLNRMNQTQVQALCRSFGFPPSPTLDDEGVVFNNGFHSPDDGSKSIAISVLSFSPLSVQANVLGGTTEHADRVIREAMAIAHPAMNWNALVNNVTRRQYTTRTKVQLPFSLGDLLSDRFLDILKEAASLQGGFLTGGDGTMVDIRDADVLELAVGDNPESEFIVHDIRCFVRVKNPNTYKTLSYDVNISAQSVEDALRNRYLITSELSYEKHIELVERLISKGEEAGTKVEPSGVPKR